MSAVLHRITKQFIRSANTPNYPTADWIINPDLSAIAGYANKYWVISGDTISLMDVATRASLDATLISAEKNSLAVNLDRVVRAIITALNDGSFVPNSGYTRNQIKNIIRGKL